MAQGHTDLRIVKLHRRGLSLEAIAKRIGRPGDIERVRQALARAADDFEPPELVENEIPTEPMKCENCGKVKKPFSYCPSAKTAWCQVCHVSWSVEAGFEEE